SDSPGPCSWRSLRTGACRSGSSNDSRSTRSSSGSSSPGGGSCAMLRNGAAIWKLGADRRSIARLCDILSEPRSQRSLMKILILAPGSRGDVEPALRIALGLMADGHETTVVAHADYEHSVTALGCSFAPF